MTTTPLDRFTQLTDALRDGKPRPDRQAAAFTAVALVHAKGEVAALVAETKAKHEALRQALGSFHAPEGSMRWVYAAMLTANQVEVAHFLSLRDQLRALNKQSKTGTLATGGARAALVLSLGETDVRSVPAFFDMKRALRPPWWRANVAITDTYAAAHVLAGADPASVIADRLRAETVFGADKRARDYKRDGARQAVLLGDAPEAVLARFNALEDARREDRFLRGRSVRSMSMDWAASGRSAMDLVKISQLAQALPKNLGSAGYGRARLATMIGFEGQEDDPVRSASALAAVVAAQAAMIAAVMVSTTVVTAS
jgi:hypothetical protein